MISRSKFSQGRAFKAFRFALLASLVAFQCAAAGPARQQSRPQAAPAPRATVAQSEVLSPIGVPGGGTQGKISFSNTDAKGDCPAGATKIERCSGVYPNGNSWEIAPCCRTETH